MAAGGIGGAGAAHHGTPSGFWVVGFELALSGGPVSVWAECCVVIGLVSRNWVGHGHLIWTSTNDTYSGLMKLLHTWIM